MNFNSIAACVITAGALAISGCSGQAADSNQSSEANQSSTKQGDAVGTAEAAVTNTATPSGSDYGEVAGTVHLKVNNDDGYSASMEVVIHKPTLRLSMAEMPAWCAIRFTPKNPKEDLSKASSISLISTESVVKLDPHEGSPAPTDWAPAPETSTNIPNTYYGHGSCAANSSGGAAPALTDAGYTTVSVEAAYGRATPSNPLPKTTEEIPFNMADTATYYLTIRDASKCTMLPTEQFSFSEIHGPEANSPTRNNGKCHFRLSPKVAS